MSGLTFVSYPPRRTEPSNALRTTGVAVPVSPASESLEATPVAEL